MSAATNIPEEYQQSFRRLLPYMISALRSDEEVIKAIILYLKMGDEKLARIAIEAMNANHRITEAALKRKLREEIMLREQNENENDDENDDDDDDDDDNDLDDDESSD